MRDPWFHHRRSSQLAHEERKNSEAPSEVRRRATQPNRLSSSSPRSPSFEFVCRLAPAIGWPTTEVERRPFPPFFGHATFLVIDGMEMRSANTTHFRAERRCPRQAFDGFPLHVINQERRAFEASVSIECFATSIGSLRRQRLHMGMRRRIRLDGA